MTKTIIGLILGVVLFSGNASAWDFHSPEERPTRGTAYTGAPMQKRLVVGFFGTQFDEMLAVVGLTFSPVKYWEFGMNLAHLGAGIVNINTKFNLLDKKYGGLGVGIGFIWAHGDWLWVLPPFQQRLAKGIDIFVIPLNLIGSIEATRWLHFDLTVGYNHVEVVGEMNGSQLFYDGELAAQQVFVLPKVRFFIWDKVSLNISGKLALWARMYYEAVAEVNITPGLRGGVRSAKYKVEDPLYDWLVTAAIKTELIEKLYLGVNLSVGPFTEKVYKHTLNTGLDLEWRF